MDKEITNERIEKLVRQVEKESEKNVGYGWVRNCLTDESKTRIFLEKGLGNKFKEYSWDYLEEYVPDIYFFGNSFHVNRGEFVIFEQSHFPDWVRVYSNDLDYRFEVKGTAINKNIRAKFHSVIHIMVPGR
jgi:hypothetical protein